MWVYVALEDLLQCHHHGYECLNGKESNWGVLVGDDASGIVLVGLTEVVGATETGGVIIPRVVSIIQVRNMLLTCVKTTCGHSYQIH